MYSNLPAPFCCITKTLVFVGIIKDSELAILSDAVIVSKGNQNKWRNHELWISNLIYKPHKDNFDIVEVGDVDLKQELCTIIKCSNKWLPLLKIGMPHPVHPKTSPVVTLAVKKKDSLV